MNLKNKDFNNFKKFNDEVEEFLKVKLEEGYAPDLITHVMAGEATSLGLTFSSDPKETFANILSAMVQVINLHLKTETGTSNDNACEFNLSKNIKSKKLN